MTVSKKNFERITRLAPAIDRPARQIRMEKTGEWPENLMEVFAGLQIT
ncbi:MAG: hypothetical protein NT009_12710 [Proteobacteria bacterium]|nr:hypothetical protein [Pseudomonadota bacterium]